MPHGGGEVGKGDGSIDLEHVFPWESDADSEIVFFFSGFGKSTAWIFFFPRCSELFSAGWWFGTFSMFPYIGNTTPI